MEQKIDSVLAEPLLKKGRFTLRTADFILLLAVTAVAFLARFGLFSHVSGDYTSFLSNWFDTLKNAGGLAGIGMNIGDYTPPYLYILALLTYLPVEALISIKLVSCIFDFLLALYAAKTVFHLTAKPRQNTACLYAGAALPHSCIKRKRMGAVRLHFYIFPASFVLQRTEKPSVAGLYFFRHRFRV